MRSVKFRGSPGSVALVLLLLALGVAAAPTAGAQELAAPEEVHLPILVKMLSFDRTFARPQGAPFVFGIAYQREYRHSVEVKDRIMALARPGAGGPFGNLEVRCVAVDLGASRNWDRELDSLGVQVLYVAPLRAFSLRDLTRKTRSAHILTVSGVPEYVEGGLSAGVGVNGERPLIVINLDAAKAEGADFNSQLLGLARIVH